MFRESAYCNSVLLELVCVVVSNIALHLAMDFSSTLFNNHWPEVFYPHTLVHTQTHSWQPCQKPSNAVRSSSSHINFVEDPRGSVCLRFMPPTVHLVIPRALCALWKRGRFRLISLVVLFCGQRSALTRHVCHVICVKRLTSILRSLLSYSLGVSGPSGGHPLVLKSYWRRANGGNVVGGCVARAHPPSRQCAALQTGSLSFLLSPP